MENKEIENIGIKVALGIAVALFLGAAFYALNLYDKSNEIQRELTEEKTLVMNDLNEMASKYDEAISENDIANGNLVKARNRIQGLMDSLSISQTNVKSLWRYKSKYRTLQKEMDVLLAQNDSLRVENTYLSTSLDSTRVRLEERAMFTDSLLVQNNALAEVVENASVLSAFGLKGSGVIERTSGKLIPTERASRTDKIRICFTVAKNTLVQTGDHELYVQIIDPKNNILGLNEQVQFDGQILNYSLISKFNYEDKSLNICEFVRSEGDNVFEEGRYIINVFNAKDLVSSTTLNLK